MSHFTPLVVVQLPPSCSGTPIEILSGRPVGMCPAPPGTAPGGGGGIAASTPPLGAPPSSSPGGGLPPPSVLLSPFPPPPWPPSAGCPCSPLGPLSSPPHAAIDAVTNS